jgi:hypothetical protein
LEPNFKSIQTTSKFKQNLRANLFKVSNYYMLGSRKCNVIHARLRHQCSSLGAVLNIIYICVCVIFVDIIICVLFVGRERTVHKL